MATYVVPGPEGLFRDTWHSVIDRSFLTHADLFAAGMLVAVLRVEHEHARFALSRAARVRELLPVCFTVFFALLSYYELPHYIDEPLTAVLFAVVLVARVVTHRPARAPRRFVRLLERRPLVAAGTISYSAFLWSFPATEFLVQHRLLLRGARSGRCRSTSRSSHRSSPPSRRSPTSPWSAPCSSLRRRPGPAPVAAADRA